MKLSKQVTDLMGLKVNYCRAKVKEDGTTELFKGNGVIVGVIVGTSRRIQLMVKDDSESKDKAFSLDPLCVGCTDADADKFWAHHVKLQAIVKKHNEDQRQREQDKIKEVDGINAKMFGAELAI